MTLLSRYATSAIRFPNIGTSNATSACANCQHKARSNGEDGDGQCGSLEQAVTSRRRVKRGAVLFNGGDKFGSLFYVRSGFFKTCLSAKDGREQVTGFHVVGDILGLDGIASGHLTTDAVALEDSEVWTLSFDLIEQYSKECASLRFQFLKTICSEVVRLQGLALMLGSLKAEERVAVFLINLLDKLKSRGMSQSEVLLRMSRDEIGSFLGIRQETVSRLLRVFSERRILEVDNRHIRVIDSSLLKLMAEPQGTLH